MRYKLLALTMPVNAAGHCSGRITPSAPVLPLCRRVPGSAWCPGGTGIDAVWTLNGISHNVVPPHKWAVGTTFEWEFEFPMHTNPFYEAEPEPKKLANPKAKSTGAPNTSKPAATKPAKPKPPKKPKRTRLTVEERQERARARAVETRSKLKESGLCRDCRQPAIPGQTRCTNCAEQHRKSRGPRRSKTDAPDTVTS